MPISRAELDVLNCGGSVAPRSVYVAGNRKTEKTAGVDEEENKQDTNMAADSDVSCLAY